ncbi:protein McbF [Escherichia coli TA464]|nr:protein McbF [Escherichia coli TA464]
MLTLYQNVLLFLLDEPTVGIDIQYRMMLWELINKITVDAYGFSNFSLGTFIEYAELNPASSLFISCSGSNLK